MKHNIGIYKIINKITNDFYIGSSVMLSIRKYGHFSQLRHNKHNNKFLQSAVNKYGLENFTFEVIEKCSLESVREKEQFYIDSLLPKYNFAKVVNEFYEKPTSLETKQKLSDIWHSTTCLKFNEKNLKLNPQKVKEIIELFNSQKDINSIMELYNIKKGTILGILSGRKWKRYSMLVDKELYNKFKNERKVYNILLLNSKKEVIKTFGSLFEIRQAFNLSSNNLSNLLTKQTLYKRSYYFIKETDYPLFINKHKKSYQRIKVSFNDKEYIFSSQQECALFLNKSEACISYHIHHSKNRLDHKYKIEKI